MAYYRTGRGPENPATIGRDLFIILLVIVTIVGAATGSALVVALSGIALVVTVVARAWSAVSLKDLEYTMSSKSTHVFAGDEIDVVLRYENKKPVPVPWLHTHELVPTGVEIVGRENLFMDYMGGTPLDEVVSLGRYERLTLHRKFKAIRRGHYTFGPAEITSGDLFGLYTRKIVAERHQWSLIVYPSTIDLPELELPTARPIGDVRSRHTLWRDPTRPAGVTEYRPGDSIKSIDWKVTARRGSLFVRQFDPSVSQYAMVLLEGATTARPWEGFRLDVLEALASCAGSVVIHAANLGFRVGLVTNSTLSMGGRNVVRPASGGQQVPMILETLAMMRPATVAHLDSVARSRARDALPAGATIVYVAGQLRDTAVAYVIDLARRGHPVVTLWVGREDPPVIPGLVIRDYRGLFGTLPETADAAFTRPDGRGLAVKDGEAASV